MNQLDRAMADYSEAIRLKPDFAGAYFNRANGHRRRNDNEAALADWAEALRIKPDFAEVYASRAFMHRALGDYARSLDDYQSALKIDPRQPSAIGGLAWLAASCPDASFRNGRRAVEFAERACELTNYNEYAHLLNLAAAYAAAGRFNEAIRWQKQILAQPDLTEARRTTGLQRLALYEQRKPYHAPWPAGVTPPVTAVK
jgi:tetratricopeptide (TPR) repeat protein